MYKQNKNVRQEVNYREEERDKPTEAMTLTLTIQELQTS